MTSSSVAPLNKEYIETESPLWYGLYVICRISPLIKSSSSYIYFGEETRANHVDLPIYVGSIPTEHLGSFNEKLKVSFERIVKEGIDMERMAMVLNRDERQVIKTPQSFPRYLTCYSCVANLNLPKATRFLAPSSLISCTEQKMDLI